MGFDIDVRRRLGDRAIALRLTGGPGVTALVGPSGVGKTSILNMVAGLLRPDEGHIGVAGTTLFDAARRIDLPPSRRRAGYVFQDGRLFPHLRVRANLMFGAGRNGGNMDFDRIVAMLGIAHLLHRWPASLSGGEAQRVAIGRALLSSPRLLLMDEPLSSVDPARREEILTLIERVRDASPLPILYVSHDRAEVDRLADHVVELTG
ncbi:molybdate transport system ATP-binding protein [Sphingobium fontiphilum]|uniref:Molybdate transport system ATP-binding protein n=1 Tax=Sphingobium fontiphilum TaxID=944425 RepID=A0A7W6GNR6_9SPHN|nr:ATP-binding cassette domain-containing protein [Sphingobium fontiphilum]MBB3981603.1 molybdate transport system ATP-binding protein [Sphingobium fontiphilum]